MDASGWTWAAITFHRSRSSACSTLSILEMRMKMRPPPDSLNEFFAQRERKRIRPEEKIPLDLSDHERELILEHTFSDDQLTRRLRVLPRVGQPATYRYNLSELEDLAGYLAAEANHAKDKKLKKHLARLFGRIQTVLESYTDDDE
jgi:hypothetical protein